MNFRRNYSEASKQASKQATVSYTHLTLPTNLRV